MKKVLFIATITPHINSFHIPYLKWFKEQGYEVHVASKGNEHIEHCDKHFNLSFERFPIKKNNIKAYKELKKIIDENDYEIIHCHTPVGGVLGRLAARKTRRKGTKVLYTAHGFHFYKGAPILNWIIYYPIEKLMARYTDCLITINQEDYDFSKKHLKAKQIELVHGVGVDENKFNFEMSEEEKNKLREGIGLNKDDYVISYVAELNKNKNQIMIIKAMEELIKYKDNIKLLLIGDGNLKEFLKNEILKNNLEKNVFLLGYRKDVSKILKITNLYVSVSKREGLPINLVEAMMSELPIIATNCRGNRDIAKKTVEINNVEELTDNIKKCIENKDYYICEKCYDYELKNVIKTMSTIYTAKRILYLLSTKTFSGAENVVCTIINRLKNNNKYNMIYCSPNGKIKDNLKEKGIDFYPLKKMSYIELKKVIKRFRPDIIHANDYRASCIAALFYKKATIISHIHVNNILVNKLNLKSFLYCILSKRFKKIIWVSDSALDNYYFNKKVLNKSIVLYNVIDSKMVEEKSKQFECNYEYDLMFLGRLSPIKNPEKLIQITKMISNKKNDIKLAIIGDGELKNQIEYMIKENNLERNVSILGYKDNPYPYLRKTKILVITSIAEGTPMAALEALSLGVIVISTPIDGLKKIIIDGENGFLLSSNDEFCDKILDLLNNKRLLEDISKKSKIIFKNLNDINIYIEKIEDIYK